MLDTAPFFKKLVARVGVSLFLNISLTSFKPERLSIYLPSTNNSPSPKLLELLSTSFNAEAAKSLPFVKLKFNEPATELLGFIVIISLL